MDLHQLLERVNPDDSWQLAIETDMIEVNRHDSHAS